MRSEVFSNKSINKPMCLHDFDDCTSNRYTTISSYNEFGMSKHMCFIGVFVDVPQVLYVFGQTSHLGR